MKRIACPKCGNFVTFDEKAYPANRILVFECAACKKQFKVRVNKSQDEEAEEQAYGYLTVIENNFHQKQILPLRMGPNIVGRYVRGTSANAAIVTTDPSMDTTHCIIDVKRNKKGKLMFVLRDAPSGTGTFYQDEILRDSDRINMDNDAIITIGATSMLFSIAKNQTS
ncbi:MAG: FHA domain-containing protein [Bacteroidaceae bacterium]|nr:FHA domain-containing protein [Bacteroidaceae bacterium]